MNSGGASGGWEKNLEKFFDRGLRGVMQVSTPVKNLYQVGHWTSILGGAPIGLMSGKIVADLVNFRLRWGGVAARSRL